MTQNATPEGLNREGASAVSSVKELLRVQGLEFIRQAYLCVLNRLPDPVGLEEYRGQLSLGNLSKMGLLKDLADSEEGRRHKSSLAGLRVGILGYKIRRSVVDRIPILRSLIRWIAALAKLPRISQQLDRLHSRVEYGLGEQLAAMAAEQTRFQSEMDQWRVDTNYRIEDLRALQVALAENLAAQTSSYLGLNHVVTVEHDGLIKAMIEASRSQTAKLEKSIEDYLNLNHVVRVEHENHFRAILESERTSISKIDKCIEDYLELNHIVRVEHVNQLGALVNAGSHALEKFEQLEKNHLELNHIARVIHEGRLNQLDQGLGNWGSQVDAHWKEFLGLNHVVQVELRAELAQLFQSGESRLTDLERRAKDYRLQLVDQDRRLGIFLGEARKRLPAPYNNEQIKALLSEESHLLDALYVSFEDRFRGTRSDIKARVKYYVPKLVAAGVGRTDTPVLDVGCGRGEWLEVLKESGLVAQGLDSNRVMVSQCRELGLEVKECDVIEGLRSVSTGSLGMVTGFHIAEHLPLHVLISLLDEAFRALVPGGLILLETPNPENILTASCNFYLDPTHRNPLPPSLMHFLAEARGFVDLEIVRLHPMEFYPELDPSMPQLLQDLLKAPQDYAIIGRKR